MELHIVKDVENYRNIFLPYIESFVESAKGRYDIEDVFSNVKNGHWILWVVHEEGDVKAVLLTQTIQYPKLKEFQIIMCVGDKHKEWYHLISKIEEYAKLIGCTKLTALTRPGWEKIMLEYKKSHIYQERDL